jgi:hypothetical protein
MTLRNDLASIRIYLQTIASPPAFPHIARMHQAAIRKHIRTALILFANLSLASPLLSGQTPTPDTLKAFDNYVQAAEARNNEELAARKNFLILDVLPRREREDANRLLRRRQTIIRHSVSCASRDCSNIPGGIIHDWTGITFVPGVTLQQTLTALQDYDRDADYYHPTVLRAKLLSREGKSFHVFLRLKETHVVTVVLDTEYEIQYLSLDSTHAASISHSAQITEIENAGSPQEHPTPPKDNHGFLWRLNSYWRFREADGGVYIQCNAISLTRDIPAGFGWLARPFIENVPRESLNFTLTATRDALIKKFKSESSK